MKSESTGFKFHNLFKNWGKFVMDLTQICNINFHKVPDIIETLFYVEKFAHLNRRPKKLSQRTLLFE